MLGKLAWFKVISENRHTIFKLIKEGFVGRRDRPTVSNAAVPYEEAAAEVVNEAGA
jgi:hypothetical protein